MTQWFTGKCKATAEEIMLVNFGGWPVLLPGPKVTCPSGAPAGLCMAMACWQASAGLPLGLGRSRQAAVLQKSANAWGKKKKRNWPEALGGSRVSGALPQPGIRPVK